MKTCMLTVLALGLLTLSGCAMTEEHSGSPERTCVPGELCRCGQTEKDEMMREGKTATEKPDAAASEIDTVHGVTAP